MYEILQVHFRLLFDVSITNAYILSYFAPTTSITGSAHTLKKFRLTLATDLIGNSCSRKRAGRPKTSTPFPHPPPLLPSADNGSPPHTQPLHVQFHIPSHNQSKRCMSCALYCTPPRRKESVWNCKECLGQPTLCLTGRAYGSDCYNIWHSNQL